MTSELWLFLVLILTLIIYIYRKFCTYSDEFLKLALKVPGPRPLPLIGTSYQYIGATTNTMLQKLVEDCKTYTPVCGHWMGPEFFAIISKPKDVEVVLNGKTKVEKGMFYKILANGMGDGLITSEEKRWKKHRKLLNPMFSSKMLPSYVKVFFSKTMDLCEKLECEVNNTDFNIYPYLEKTGFNISFANAIPKKYESEHLHGREIILSILKRTEHEVIDRIFKPWLYLNFIYDNLPRGKKFEMDITFVRNFVKQLFSKMRDEMQSNLISFNKYDVNEEGILNHMIRIQADLENQFTVEDLTDEVINIMAAAIDTSTAAVGFIILHLSRNFDIQDRVVEEIRQEFGTLEDVPITCDVLLKLKYLDRVVKEGLRLYPPVPYVSRRLMENVKLPSGINLPKGSTVFLMFYHMHRDPEMFLNPDDFNPDNFLPEKVSSRYAHAFTPFSSGPRNCIGQKYAMLSVKTQLVGLLRRFVFTPTNFEPNLKATISLTSSNGIRVGMKRRNDVRSV